VIGIGSVAHAEEEAERDDRDEADHFHAIPGAFPGAFQQKNLARVLTQDLREWRRGL
jgi:hypothetical protein